jgi:hypothetical protein
MKIPDLWNETECFWVVYTYQNFGGIFYLLLHISSCTSNMEAVSFSKTFVPLYQPTRRIFSRRLGNLSLLF